MSRDPRRDSPILRVFVGLLAVVARLVPRPLRGDWQREWEAEVRHRWTWLETRRALDWRQTMDLFRRLLGSAADAAWLRRQVTLDADVVHDLRHAVRLLRRNLGFTCAAIGILGVAIGANTAVFSVIDRLLLRELPYASADRVVTLWQTNAAEGVEREEVAPANFLDWRERSQSFEAMAAADPYSFDYSDGDTPEVLFAALVTEGYFEALGVRPLHGRTFIPEDHQPGRNRVAVLSHDLWQRRFAGDPAVIGRVVRLSGAPWTIIGVLPPGIEPRLLPTAGERGVVAPKVIAEYEPRIRGSAYWAVVGRLKPGVALEHARAEADSIAAALAREYPRTNANVGIRILPLREHLAGGLRSTLNILAGAVGLVLLLACANVANMLLARGAEREREFAVRSALGAGHGRLVRQALAESTLLAAAGCAVGLLIGRWGIMLIVALGPASLRQLAGATLDLRVLVFTAAITSLTAITFGLGPSWRLARRDGSERQPGAGAMGSRATSRTAARRVLVVAEIALATTLLAGAGLLVRGFIQLSRVDPGFTSRNVLALQMFARTRHTAPHQRATYFAEVLDRTRRLPGVEAAGLVAAMPFIEANLNMESPVRIEGRPAPAANEEPSAFVNIATSGYFNAMGIPLRRGRLFTDHDRMDSRRVALITESLARRHWPAGDPIGQRITLRFEGQETTTEIVGVVGTVRHDGLDHQPRPEVFLPHAQSPYGSMTLVLRTAGDPRLQMEAARQQVWAVDPLQTFYRTATLDELVGGSVRERRFATVILATLAAIGLALAMIGIYALISYSTSRRTREIGIRMALGARAGAIVAMVMTEGIRLAACGVGLGFAGAFTFSRFLQSLLFEVTPYDPLTMALVSTLIVAVALAAAYVPARRAARIDPVQALKLEA
jgi:putative ABC transport system permease protein